MPRGSACSVEAARYFEALELIATSYRIYGHAGAGNDAEVEKLRFISGFGRLCL